MAYASQNVDMAFMKDAAITNYTDSQKIEMRNYLESWSHMEHT